MVSVGLPDGGVLSPLVCVRVLVAAGRVGRIFFSLVPLVGTVRIKTVR